MCYDTAGLDAWRETEEPVALVDFLHIYAKNPINGHP
jgi:hypothetical protein